MGRDIKLHVIGLHVVSNLSRLRPGRGLRAFTAPIVNMDMGLRELKDMHLSPVANVGLALAGACVLLVVSYCTETATYSTLKWLETSGCIERLAPQLPTTVTSYTKQTAITSFVSGGAVLLLALHPSVFKPLVATAQPSWNWVEIVATCWFGVAAHDLWFFLIHTILHKTKIHVTHHKLGGDLTLFGTADMDPFEAIAMVFGFYAAVLVLYVKMGRWNPIAYVFLVLLEANMNQMGHCGYRQPLWLALVQSWGVYLTPGVAHAKTHYIHHLDPRYNRALYFSWWDRVAGTFRDKHPQIREFNPQEQWEYEMRAPRLLYKRSIQACRYLLGRFMPAAACNTRAKG